MRDLATEKISYKEARQVRVLDNDSNPIAKIQKFFEKNRREIELKIESRLKVVGQRYQEELSFESLQAEVIIKTNSLPIRLINNQRIQEVLDKVIRDNGLDEGTNLYESKNTAASNLGRSNEQNGEFLLEGSTGIDELHAPENHRKIKQHQSAKKIRFRNRDKELTIPKFKSITQDKSKWQNLSWRQYLVIISLLNGFSRKETAELLETRKEKITHLAYKARCKLDLSLKKLREIAQENLGKRLRQDKYLGAKALHKLIYNIEIDDKDTLDKTVKLTNEVLDKLTLQQAKIIKLLINGYSRSEITTLTNKTKDSIDGSLRDLKKRLLKLIDAINNSTTPDGIDYDKWNNLSERSQDVFIEYVLKGKSSSDLVDQFKFKSSKDFYTRMRDTRRALNISFEEMLVMIDKNKLKNTTKEDLIDRTINTIYENNNINSINKKETFIRICRALKTLRKNSNYRPFKLYLRGLDVERVAYYLGQSPGQCQRNIDSVSKQIRNKLGL